MDVFQTPITHKNKGNSFKNLLFDEDYQKNNRNAILIKKKMQQVNDFYDLCDVYNAQTDHVDKCNDLFFDSLHDKLDAELQSEQLVKGSWHSLHDRHHSTRKHLFDKNKDKDRDRDHYHHHNQISDSEHDEYKDSSSSILHKQI